MRCAVTLIQSRALLFLSLLGVVAFATGCGRGGGQVVEPEERIKLAGRVYQKFISTHRGQGPKNEAEWNDFISQLGKDKKALEEMQIDDLDLAMTSPRDGQKYVVVYGESFTSVPKTKDPTKVRRPIAMYEKEGQGGTRYVFYAMGGSFQKMDEKEFQEVMGGGK